MSVQSVMYAISIFSDVMRKIGYLFVLEKNVIILVYWEQCKTLVLNILEGKLKNPHIDLHMTVKYHEPFNKKIKYLNMKIKCQYKGTSIHFFKSSKKSNTYGAFNNTYHYWNSWTKFFLLSTIVSIMHRLLWTNDWFLPMVSILVPFSG